MQYCNEVILPNKSFRDMPILSLDLFQLTKQQIYKAKSGPKATTKTQWTCKKGEIALEIWVLAWLAMHNKSDLPESTSQGLLWRGPPIKGPFPKPTTLLCPSLSKKNHSLYFSAD